MAKIFGATTLIGGGATALDSIDGDDLSDGDAAVVITDSGTYWYHLNATSGATENSPFRVAPDSNAGDKRWHLVGTTKRLGALVKRSTDQSIANNSSTDMTWGAESYDDADFWEGVTNPSRLTIPTGVTSARLSAGVRFASNSSGYRQTYLTKNGSPSFDGRCMLTFDACGSSQADLSIVSPVLSVTGGDYFSCIVHQTSGGSLNVTAGDFTYFSIEAVGFA